MPTARRSVTPVAAEQHGEDDGGKPQMNLRVFARDFERAYAGFDGEDGRLKVATGMDSDPRSLSFGHSTVWVMRWSQGQGVAMTRAVSGCVHPQKSGGIKWRRNLAAT